MKTIDEKYTVTSSAPSRLQAVPISKLLEIGITEDELIGLQHQSEELMDAAGYALAAKRELTKLLEIKRAATALVESVSCHDVTPATRRRLTSDLKLALQQ